MGHIKRPCRGKVDTAQPQRRHKQNTDKNTKYVEAQETIDNVVNRKCPRL